MKKIIEIKHDGDDECSDCPFMNHDDGWTSCNLSLEPGKDCPGPGKQCMILLNEKDLTKLEKLLNEIPVTEWRKDVRTKIKKIIELLGLEGLKDEQSR